MLSYLIEEFMNQPIKAAFLTMILLGSARAAPIALHPDNPHYLLFRGSPTLLIGSTEHYGAVLNLDFDSIPYLDELKAGTQSDPDVLGHVSGSPRSFQIKRNTLAPTRGRRSPPGPARNARQRRRRQQVSTSTVGRRLFPPAEGFLGRSRAPRGRRRLSSSARSTKILCGISTR